MTSTSLILRPTVQDDLATLFVFQLDEEAIYMAAFTPKDPHDKNAYIEKFSKLIADPTINMKTVLLDGVIIGSIARFYIEGDAEITYWFDKKHWGKGIATAVLHDFLKTEQVRPLYARTAYDNFGSQRVLEKNHFEKTGRDSGFANARQAETEEFIFRLSV